MQNHPNYHQLLQRLENLHNKQQQLSHEIEQIRSQLQQSNQPPHPPQPPQSPQPPQPKTPPPSVPYRVNPTPPRGTSNLETFIGENLMNKIGILITILGVGIGIKYTLDKGILTPIARILLGYLSGVILLGLGIKLKQNFKNYSAVLVSGAAAIFYLVTYFAHSMYHLFPYGLTFFFMLLLTLSTTLTALHYNRQVIAHIGLVGAYTIPFLLSSNSGNAFVLFTYMTLINLGILFIAVKRYWKPLYYVSFLLSYLIFSSWYFFEAAPSDLPQTAMLFLCLFFALFYSTFLSYKLIHKDPFGIHDVFLIVFNSFIFFGLGYLILPSDFASFFALINALIHGVVALFLYRSKRLHYKILFLISGMAIIFLTLLIPIRFEGSWITLLWILEAALLFGIGRTQKTPFYEKLAFPLFFIAFFSLTHDWAQSYQPGEYITPLFNIQCFSTLLFASALATSLWLIHQYNKFSNPHVQTMYAATFFTLLIVTLYFGLNFEITQYWKHQYYNYTSALPHNVYIKETNITNIHLFKNLSSLNFSFLFISVLSFLNFKKLKSQALYIFLLFASVLGIILFVFQGLPNTTELKQSYVTPGPIPIVPVHGFYIGIRYFSIALFAVMLLAAHKSIVYFGSNRNVLQTEQVFLHIVAITLLSSELVYLSELLNIHVAYKTGITVLWSSYAFVLMLYGILNRQKILRILALILLGITIIKVFTFDISHLSTPAKTGIFILLGMVLLIISFLYNRFKSGAAPIKEDEQA